MLKVKGFGYDDEKDMDVIEHIDKQPHKANYIWTLVRTDMNKESIEVVIRREIERYLEGANVKKKEKSVQINTDEIMNILSM